MWPFERRKNGLTSGLEFWPAASLETSCVSLVLSWALVASSKMLFRSLAPVGEGFPVYGNESSNNRLATVGACYSTSGFEIITVGGAWTASCFRGSDLISSSLVLTSGPEMMRCSRDYSFSGFFFFDSYIFCFLLCKSTGLLFHFLPCSFQACSLLF